MSDLTDFREGKDAFFKSGDGSPLTPEQRRAFHALNYYAENPALSLVIQPEVQRELETVEIELSAGEPTDYVRWAKIPFVVAGEAAKLSVFKDEETGAIFLPFADATARGGETYGGGRYLEVEELEDGRLLVDFNYAYNPYCAYNDRWACPLPPPENRLTVRIEAGERAFHEEK